MTRRRTYEETHPWLSFDIQLQAASPHLWIALGECHSKIEHVAGFPLDPDLDKYLHQVYLAKGVAATTAIEGNTLSEQQVLAQIEGKLVVPPSQEYLQQEVSNILDGCNLILKEISTRQPPPLTADRVKTLNGIVLKNLPLNDPDVIPGEVRRHSVGVGTYRAAPAEDCEYLLGRLCEWLNGDAFKAQPGMESIYAILRAVIAHLYIAWIHPFGDGNGRTARLIELQILMSSAVPSPAAHLLSNHYNKTRNEYYRQLEAARRDVLPFLLYAVSGLRDGLREEIETLRYEQWEIAWTNYVHRKFDGMKGAADNRRKHLILDLSKQREAVPFAKLRSITPRIAVAYNNMSNRTLARDLEKLAAMGLATQDDPGKWRAKKGVILSLLPTRANLLNG